MVTKCLRNNITQCAAVCPVDCCVPGPDHVESKEELLAKKDKLDEMGR